MNPVHVVLHCRAGPTLAGIVKEAPAWLSVHIVAEDDDVALRENLADARVLFHVLEPVTAHLMDLAPRLELIQKIGVGINTIDLDAAALRGLRVANMPGSNTPATAEATIALMLAATRRIVSLDAAVRSGRGWPVDTSLTDGIRELADMTVGLVGFGAVGRRVAELLHAFGARVLYNATAPARGGSGAPGAIAQWRTLPDLLAEADIVSLHAALTPQTTRMIGRQEFGAMKRGAVLINTARGALVDQGALVDALRSGHLGAAGLDVYDPEPIEDGDPLLTLGNVVLTPHVAWSSISTMRRCMELAFENCRRLECGEPLLHEIPVSRT